MVDEEVLGTDTGADTGLHPDDIQGLNIPYIIMVGMTFVVLFFTFFMICARRWDKWITKRFFSTKIFTPQHMNSFGSSHMSAAVDDSRWEEMSNGIDTRSGDEIIPVEGEEIDISSGSSVNNAWVDEMMHELSNFPSILFERGRTHRAHERTKTPDNGLENDEHNHRHPPTPIPISMDPRMDAYDYSIYEHDERIYGEITTYEHRRRDNSNENTNANTHIHMNSTSLDSDWSSITGSSSASGGIHIVSSSSTRSNDDQDSNYLTSYESYESFTCSSDSETVKIKNSKSDPSDEEDSSSVSSGEFRDWKPGIGYHPSSQREV